MVFWNTYALMWLALLGVKITVPACKTALFPNSWLLIRGDRGLSLSLSLLSSAEGGWLRANCRLSVAAWQLWWSADENQMFSGQRVQLNARTHTQLRRCFRDIELLREGSQGLLPTLFPDRNVVYLFVDCTTSGKFVSPPKQCHSIFLCRPTSKCRARGRTTSWT